MEIVDEQNRLARVDVAGVQRNVNVGLVIPDGLKVGDWVLVHVGFALSIIDEQEAEDTLKFLHGLGEAYESEMEMLASSQIE